MPEAKQVEGDVCCGCSRAREKHERWVWVYPPAPIRRPLLGRPPDRDPPAPLKPDAQYCQACAAERGYTQAVH